MWHRKIRSSLANFHYGLYIASCSQINFSSFMARRYRFSSAVDSFCWVLKALNTCKSNRSKTLPHRAVLPCKLFLFCSHVENVTP
uniref:Uncharacterized protein n=1 Tax=Picea glauca TaxID=3330 RepID=A0A117NI24_PICGL|nr:hypothetical protein ABT39_MTgene3859 [Picea glauca]QHR86129.1 hypothetical protein Q903MT_gene128 [Picea sitchensis]